MPKWFAGMPKTFPDIRWQDTWKFLRLSVGVNVLPINCLLWIITADRSGLKRPPTEPLNACVCVNLYVLWRIFNFSGTLFMWSLHYTLGYHCSYLRIFLLTDIFWNEQVTSITTLNWMFVYCAVLSRGNSIDFVTSYQIKSHRNNANKIIFKMALYLM